MIDSNFLIVIPARLKSSRVPNKLNIQFGTKTLLQRVYEKAVACHDDVLVAYDDQDLVAGIIDTNHRCQTVSQKAVTGCDRAALALSGKYGHYNNPVVVLQADNYDWDYKDVVKMVGMCKQSSLVTGYTDIQDHEIEDRDVVKVILNSESDYVDCFTRSSPMFPTKRYKHIGVYVFAWPFLDVVYGTGKKTPWEHMEKLEQLRVYSYGYKWKAYKCAGKWTEVNNYSDIGKIMSGGDRL